MKDFNQSKTAILVEDLDYYNIWLWFLQVISCSQLSAEITKNPPKLNELFTD